MPQYLLLVVSALYLCISKSASTETVADMSLFPWYWSMYSTVHNIIIVAPAKAMHTTIRNVLNHKECSADTPHCSEVKKNRDKFNDLFKLHIYNTATRVLIIRDPFERALSAYMNSIRNPYINVGSICVSSMECTFEEWIQAINQLGAACNEHFYSITNISNYNMIKYHYVIVMNNKSERLFLWNMLNETIDNQFNISPNNQQDIQTKLSYFTPNVIKLLKLLYNDDILLYASHRKYKAYFNNSEITTMKCDNHTDNQEISLFDHIMSN